MREVWKFGLRWLTILGLAGIVFVSGGCGGDDDEDNAAPNDTTPDAFRFRPWTSAVPGYPLSSPDAITVTGINAPAPISITGGAYSIDGGAFTSAAGTVHNGQRVQVRHTAAATHSTITTSTLTIGGVSAPWIMITTPLEGADVTADPFSFTPQTHVPPGTVATSNTVTVTGIDNPANILILGGTYSIDGGPFTSYPGLINNGQRLTIQHTSSAAANSSTTTNVGIGNFGTSFITTTGAAVGNDTTPDTFGFTPQTGVPVSTVIGSNGIRVTGIDASAPISITGGTYSTDYITYTSEPGTLRNWSTVVVRHTSSPTTNTVTTTTLTIGGVSAVFTSTTQAALAGTAIPLPLYQTRCAECHRVGTVDPLGPSNLSGTAQMTTRFPTPTTSHFGATLTTEERETLTTYFRNN